MGELSKLYTHGNASQLTLNEKVLSTPPRRNFRFPSPSSSSSSPTPSHYNIDTESQPKVEAPVTWLTLPHKSQLAILFLTRFVDFLQIASLQAYVFYQLKCFDSSLTDSQISTQAGILQGCFTGAQVLTAILWGKVADHQRFGRKFVLLVGLAGTSISCLGYGFSKTFFWAAVWRAFGGGINGTVGIIRTMISEITKEKKYQSRAFLILPMSFNVAGILGPLFGGLLADPAATLPDVFGPEGSLNFKWLENYPYALPSIISSIFLTVTTLIILFGLEETLASRANKPDPGIYFRNLLTNFIRSDPKHEYKPLQTWRSSEVTLETFSEPGTPGTPSQYESEKSSSPVKAASTEKLPFSKIWTRNVICTLLAGAFYDFHLGSFTNLWTLFLSTPRSLIPTTSVFVFSGGLGMPSPTIGLATSILGLSGMILQVSLYPPIQARLGTLNSFRFFLPLFPLVYLLAPYLSILHSSTAAPAAASGWFVWIGIVVLLLISTTARTFTLPASIILLNNCSPHPSVLGTIHGLGQSVSAGFRTVGPVVGGWWYGAGLERGVVGLAWWGTMVVSLMGCAVGWLLYEGTGHEMFLEGERDGDKVAEVGGNSTEGKWEEGLDLRGLIEEDSDEEEEGREDEKMIKKSVRSKSVVWR